MRTKFFIVFTTVFISMLLFSIESSASNINEVKVFVDGIEIEFPNQRPYIDENSRTLVPVRFLVETIGADVKWDNKDRRVDIIHMERNKNIKLWINQRNYVVNGKQQQMDTEAILTDQGSTVVPIRFISEGLGIIVKWDVIGNSGLVHAFTKDQSPIEIQQIINQVHSELISPVFAESFTDRMLINNKIVNKAGDTIWTIENAEAYEMSQNTINKLTDNSSLILGGSENMQTLSLKGADGTLSNNYTLDFGISVHSMANAGILEQPFEGRPIISVIPRARDNTLRDYYAVVYYLENNKMSGLVANLFKCKWEIIRVTEGTNIQVLDEGYYMLDERARHDASLTIKNDANGFVDISFYIDSYKKPRNQNTPLLAYKDKSPERITEGMTTLSFDVGGYDPAGFRYTPIVELDDIKVYDSENIDRVLKLKNANHSIDLSSLQESEKYELFMYLRNRGILDIKLSNLSSPQESITIADFLVMLMKSQGYNYAYSDTHWANNYIKKAIELGLIDEECNIDSTITNHDIALILYNFSNDKSIDTINKQLLDIDVSPVYERAIYYTFQHNLIEYDLDTASIAKMVSLEEASEVILRVLDNHFKIYNYSLELPRVISDGAIFQRNKKIPIWGRGHTGDRIEVKFKDQTKTTTVINGNWYLELDPEPHGGPYKLQIKGLKDKIVLTDIYIGEVFLVAGQSNAEWMVQDSFGKEDTTKNLLSQSKNKELILRYFSPQQILALTENFTTNGAWYPPDEEQIGYSSAIGTFFLEELLELNDDLDGVPIGLVTLAYGGSTIELFMPSSVIIDCYAPREHTDPIISGFWNGFMDSVSPTQFKAVLYYQGENSVQLRYEYEWMLRNFIEAMRIEFDNKDLPFILVQLAGYGQSYNDGDTWPIIREIQDRTTNTLPNVGLVTAIDLADENPWEIHPRNKKPIGVRLAYKVMDMVYNQDLNYRSPEIESYEVKDGKVIVHFNYVNGSLFFEDNRIGDLEIVGEDGVWRAAQAEIINGNSLEVWNENIVNPVGVRYAYRNYPDVTLFDDTMLPVLPFNTTKTRGEKVTGFTDEFQIMLPYHGLQDWDAVVNLTRNNTFRTVRKKDVYLLTHEYHIQNQSAGDVIQLFARRGSKVLEQGSNSTILKIKDHKLCVGDWIRNTERSYIDSRVIGIIDEDTVLVNEVAGQSSGDLIEIYQFRHMEKAR